MNTKEQELFSNVYVPAFRQKCAERGIRFSDEAQLNQALEITRSLLEKQARKSKRPAGGKVVDITNSVNRQNVDKASWLKDKAKNLKPLGLAAGGVGALGGAALGGLFGDDEGGAVRGAITGAGAGLGAHLGGYMGLGGPKGVRRGAEIIGKITPVSSPSAKKVQELRSLSLKGLGGAAGGALAAGTIAYVLSRYLKPKQQEEAKQAGVIDDH